MATRCRGFSIEPGQYSGCNGWGDCPVCEGHGVEPLRLRILSWNREEGGALTIRTVYKVDAAPFDAVLWPEDEQQVFSGALCTQGKEWYAPPLRHIGFSPYFNVRATPDMDPRRPDIIGHLCDSPVLVLAGEAAPDGSVFPEDVLWGRIRITEES